MLERIDYGQLARRLLDSGHTTASLARLLRVSQPSVSRLARGLVGVVSADVGVNLIVLNGGRVELPKLPAGAEGGQRAA